MHDPALEEVFRRGRISFLRRHKNWDQRSRVEDLLHHAVNSVERYRPLRSTGPGLSDFPFSTKEMMVADPGRFRVNDDPASSAWHIASTSGTSGPPLKFPQSFASRYATYAYTTRLVIDHITDHFGMERSELSWICIRDSLVQLPESFRYFIDEDGVRNAGLHVDLRDPGAITTLRRAFCEPKQYILNARPPTAIRLGEILRQGGEEEILAKISILVSGGDNLYDDQKSAILSRLNVEIINHYAMGEAGGMAIQCHKSGNLHVCREQCLVEILPDPGSTAGSTEGEIVVTALANWEHPFIRYRTKDFGSLKRACPGCGADVPTLTRLHGRNSRYFGAGAARYSPYVFERIFERHDEVYAFQTFQEDHGRLRVCLAGKHKAISVQTKRQIEKAIRDLELGVAVNMEEVDRAYFELEKRPRFVDMTNR